ncbi:hypothetical protein BKA67DRAFT_537953 [Truncatella angustata]|uniref:Uncharacterized protein n=1 Tax=Truncatella angustata TaxID=152316 RepID=A0A9P8UH96_9PEZI|nr:uncharacterized protein BKA67DRAFT_537953 [Truncatella angustata]KAH6652116.1 hypothetical protein BKA67DRAFT_537953 [Truncatella angustata]KAH8205029.1 hypothetical protein TruAng_000752 [Truncatella angustata]
MDDPWGSPWASAPTDSVHENGSHPPPSPPKSLLSPPPRAFFSSNTSQPVHAHSPWADNSFGDWTGSAHVDDAAPTSAWNSWTADSSLTPRAESPAKQSPIAWPSSAATSPGLKPTLIRSRSSSVFPQHSPDPWAAESPWNDRSDALSNAPGQTVVDNIQHDLSAPTQVVIHVQQPNTNPPGNENDEQVIDADDQDGLKYTGPAAVCESPVLVSNLTVEVEGHETPSRPSSTFSVESNHALDRQDSPITSIDEESNVRPRSATRKVSNKISELVGLYDGLAKAATKEPQLSERSAPGGGSRDRSASLSISANPDVENGTEHCQDPPQQNLAEVDKTRTSISSNRSSTPKVVAHDIAKRSSLDHGCKGPALVPNAASVPVQQLIDKFGAIKFEPDVTLLETAFAHDLDLNQQESEFGDTLVSDRIVEDSFQTLEERRAWYRISRFGSSRKHNSGDEENYHAVNWQTSQLHVDVIKIVRRWMEEDSFSGKPTLGGSKRTSVFNWDSSAAPVGLDKIFARRSLAARPKTHSIAPLGHTPTSSVGSLGSFLEERRSFQEIDTLSSSSGPPTALASPVASFGWSSEPRLVSTLAISSSNSNGTETKAASQNVPPALPLSPISSPLSTIPAGQTITFGQHDDDDDEWGEMVFSPTEENFTLTEDSLDQPKAISQTLASPIMTEARPVVEEIHPVFEAQNAVVTAQPSTSNHNEHHKKNSAPSGIPVPQSLYLAPSVASSSLSVDPWASADISFFDTPATNSKSATASSNTVDAPLRKPATTHCEPRDKHSSSTNYIAPSQVGVTLGPIESSDNVTATETVRRILQNLPDLTYMLR